MTIEVQPIRERDLANLRRISIETFGGLLDSTMRKQIYSSIINERIMLTNFVGNY